MQKPGNVHYEYWQIYRTGKIRENRRCLYLLFLFWPKIEKHNFGFGFLANTPLFLNAGVEQLLTQESISSKAILSTISCFPSFKVKAVDTTGAGDSFNSGFLHGLLNDYTLEESCKIGNWVASKSICGFGMEAFPSKEDLEEFLNTKV